MTEPHLTNPPLARMLDDEVKTLLGEAAKMGGALGDGETVERPRHHLEIMAIFDRCRALFGAIWLLADKGFGQEALLLLRALTTDSLMLMELAAVSEKRRIEIVVGWSLAGLAGPERAFLRSGGWW